MLLSDRELNDAITAGHLFLDPFAPGNIQPSSIDLRLNPLLTVQRRHPGAGHDPPSG